MAAIDGIPRSSSSHPSMNPLRLDRSGSVRKATAIGGTALVLWSSLAVLTTTLSDVPPFQLVSLSFGVAFLLGLILWIRTGGDIGRRFHWPAPVWLLGVGGLFGYHFFYFLAFRHAPAAEANIINYFWPLLIVLFSAALPGHRLRWWHVAGALAGFVGTLFLITEGGQMVPRAEYAQGYLAALAAAVTWASYSVLSRRFQSVPSEAVGAFCAVTAVLAMFCHLAFEVTVWPQGAQWLTVLALGLGPVGGAFFTWDHGVKHGDLRILGACSYLIPLASTALLVAFGKAELRTSLVVAAILITGGAILASRDLFRRGRVAEGD